MKAILGLEAIFFALFSLCRMGPTLFARALSYGSTVKAGPRLAQNYHRFSAVARDAEIGFPLNENYFLNQVERTIDKVFSQHIAEGSDPFDVNILDLPVEQREDFGVAINLHKRLRSLRKNNDCPRCWMQRKHCICNDCSCVSPDGPIGGGLSRIFLVCHHKEIGLKVDTSKLILSSFPFQCELVVGGIGPKNQASMKELIESLKDPRRTSLVLFPDESAKTLTEIISEHRIEETTRNEEYDLIVLDGTWAQARKFHSRYFQDSTKANFQNVKLSDDSVTILQEGSPETGHQLRRHEIAWRQVGTFEAFRLFLRDWATEFPSEERQAWKTIEKYQRIANDAALKELGPPRS